MDARTVRPSPGWMGCFLLAGVWRGRVCEVRLLRRYEAGIYVMSCHVMSCHVMSRNATQRTVTYSGGLNRSFRAVLGHPQQWP